MHRESLIYHVQHLSLLLPFYTTQIMATFNDVRALCMNQAHLSEPELVSRLRSMEIELNVLAARDPEGATLLHCAVEYGRSPEFCRVIHELDATLVKTQDNYGWLPLHEACQAVSVDTAKYLFHLFPEGIITPTISDGWYPLHLLASAHGIGDDSSDKLLELLSFLLKHDKGAVSSPDSVEALLPLHIACQERDLAFVKLLFDAYPDAIFVQNNEGETPVDVVYNPSTIREDMVHFLETQLKFHHQAQVDHGNGQLPIHRAMQSGEVSLGTIKLMVAAFPTSITATDNQGRTLLHLACRFLNLDVVKYLLGLIEDSPTLALYAVDTGGNLPLHHACLGCKLDVVNFILRISPHGVLVPNKRGKLPIDLLLFETNCVRDLQYVNAVDNLFRVNPIDSLASIMSSGLFSDKM